MKTSVCFLISMLFASLAFAGNPDERISLEFDFKKHFTSYDRTISFVDTSFSQSNNTGPIIVGFKFILPSKEYMSLILGGGYAIEKLNFENENGLFNIEDKARGFFINLGVKFYFSEETSKKLIKETTP